jgi:hypothetical protein
MITVDRGRREMASFATAQNEHLFFDEFLDKKEVVANLDENIAL